jgi:hypothetical protein
LINGAVRSPFYSADATIIDNSLGHRAATGTFCRFASSYWRPYLRAFNNLRNTLARCSPTTEEAIAGLMPASPHLHGALLSRGALAMEISNEMVSDNVRSGQHCWPHRCIIVSHASQQSGSGSVD